MKTLVLLTTLFVSAAAQADVISDIAIKSRGGNDAEVNVGLGYKYSNFATTINLGIYNNYDSNSFSINEHYQQNIIETFAFNCKMGLGIETKKQIFLESSYAFGFTTTNTNVSFVGFGNNLKFNFSNNKISVDPMIIMRTSF